MKHFTHLLLFVFLFTAARSQDARLDSLKNVARTAADDTNKVKLLNTLCRELRGTPKEGIAYGEQALALATRLGYKNGIAHAYNNIGIVHYTQGNYPQALDNYIRSLKIREELGDKSAMSKCYNNIGLIYYQQGKFDMSVSYYSKSLKIKRELNDKLGVASTLGNMGNVYYDQYNFTKDKELLGKALSLQLEAMEIQEQEDASRVGLAGTYNNVGNIYYEQRKYDMALDYQRKALEIQKEIGDKSGIAHSYINIAAVYYEQGNYDKAIGFHEQGLLVAIESDDKPSMEAAYAGLADAYEKKNDLERALKYYKLYSQVKDSIINVASTEQIAEMQAKFDSENQQRRIELLQRQTEIQHLQEQDRQNREKVIRYSIIGAMVVLLIVGVLLYNRYKLKQVAATKLEAAFHQIEFKNKEITDSIKYAKRIQEAILPPDELVDKLFPENFVLYKAKDIVSGDFYWVERWGNQTLIAAVDCTGHGVPGALMSVVGYNLLNQAVNEHGLSKPNLILNALNKGVSNTLRQKMEESSVKDGMDISLCAFDTKRMVVEFAGAYNSLYHVRDGKLTEIKGDKFPVGIFLGEEMKQFTNHEVQVQQGDSLYIFTDGYVDQFGGPEGKKFKARQFQQMILSMQDKPMSEQGALLNETIERWRGQLEQVDDILVIGVKV